MKSWDLYGDLMVKNQSCSAEDAGSNPVWGTKIHHPACHTTWLEKTMYESGRDYAQSTETNAVYFHIFLTYEKLKYKYNRTETDS